MREVAMKTVSAPLPIEFEKLIRAREDGREALSRAADRGRLELALEDVRRAWTPAAQRMAVTSHRTANAQAPVIGELTPAPSAEELERQALLQSLVDELEASRLVYEDLIRAVSRFT
jgi:hypothetical protein